MEGGGIFMSHRKWMTPGEHGPLNQLSRLKWVHNQRTCMGLHQVLCVYKVGVDVSLTLDCSWDSFPPTGGALSSLDK